MAVGFRIRDEAGALQLEMTSRITKLLGEFDIGGSGSIAVPQWALPGAEPFFLVSPIQALQVQYQVFPRVYPSGASLAWDYPAARPNYSNAVMRILYGVIG